MELFYDLESADVKSKIMQTIATNGFSAEHNYEYLCSYASDECMPVFVYFGSGKGLFALEWDDNTWQLLSEVMSSEDERVILLDEFCKEIFSSKNAENIMLEVPPTFHKDITNQVLRDNNLFSGLKIGDITHKLFTPIISLDKWDINLQGPEYSSLRKAKNRFFKLSNIKLLKNSETLKIPLSEYRLLVDSWRKNRSPSDTVYYEDYLSYIKNNFKGSNAQLALMINNKLCGLSVAWSLPNNSDTVYYGINLHDYSIPELGEFLSTIFFDLLKEKGYKYVDFGSSDAGLLNYKKKFRPESIVEYVCFYITQ